MAATIKDLANETGLGVATISSYLNGGRVREKNRIKIEAAIKKYDFHINEIARGLKTNRTKTVGIVIPDLTSSFFAEIITKLEDLLQEHIARARPNAAGAVEGTHDRVCVAAGRRNRILIYF